MKKLILITVVFLSTSLWAETKEIYCELNGFSEFLGRGSEVSTLPLKVTIGISLSKNSYGIEELDYVKFRQEGIQTPLYTDKSEFSSSIDYRKIYLKYFLDEKEPHPISNLNSRVYEIEIELNRLTGKAFLDGDIQGILIDSNSKTTFLRDFLDADGDCLIATERKF